MLVVDEVALAKATEMLMICARTCTDQNGLKVFVDLPRIPISQAPELPGTASGDVPALRDTTDYRRIRAIALAAVVSLTGHPCIISGEVQISLSQLTTKDTV